jgi:hypothetical protein
MASPTKGSPVTTIRLGYDEKSKRVTPKELRFKKDQLIEFVSDKPGYEVYVQLNPEAYSPSVFTPISGPVKVTKDPDETANSHAPCGFVEVATRKHVGWPADDSYGPDTWP